MLRSLSSFLVPGFGLLWLSPTVASLPASTLSSRFSSHSTDRALLGGRDATTFSNAASTAVAGVIDLTISTTSVRILYQNNLHPSTSGDHISGFLTGKVKSLDGQTLCTSLHEQPISIDSLNAHSADFLTQFAYLCYSGALSCPTHVWIQDGVIQVDPSSSSFTKLSPTGFLGQSLPQLCTQSDPEVLDSKSAPTATNQITVQDSNGNTYLGYHNKQAFRFLGIPYTNIPARFEYSTANSATHKIINATYYQAECPQYGAAAANENCLSMNIHTPYLPSASSSPSTTLRPVLLWIHGGAFVAGSGSASSISGDNLGAREDIVVVSINYRLNTYGFMALSSTSMSGNYGISDMVSALDWLHANIASFGGDPNQITVAGQSAGAAAVRILLGSPKAIGKFARAIVMSNLGGGADLGLGGDYGSTNSEYYSIAESVEATGNSVLAETGCESSGNEAAQIQCLKAYTGDLSALSTTSRFPVQDGQYINTPYFEVGKKGNSIAHVPVLMGNTANDGASFIGYSKTCSSLSSCIAADLDISAATAQSIVSSGLFPVYDSGDLHLDAFNVSQRVYTDNTFRCIDQATAYAGFESGSLGPVFYYQAHRTIGGFNPDAVDSTGPKSSAFPSGDPNQPYFRLHSSEIAFAFGNEDVFRDEDDYSFAKVMVAYWGAFVRAGDPNPEAGFLKARGYGDVLNAVQATGQWAQVGGKQGPVLELDFPAKMGVFAEAAQCGWLNYTLEYYLD